MNEEQSKLNKYMSQIGAWSMAVGGILGWGSFVMPGTVFLPFAGPLGTITGMTLGAVLILSVAVNYHFLMNRYPESGGAFSYIKNIFGYDHSRNHLYFINLVKFNCCCFNRSAAF